MSDTLEQNPSVDFSQYIVLFAGDFGGAMDIIGVTTEIGLKVRVVATGGAAEEGLRSLALDELVLAGDLDTLAHEAFRRCSSAHLVVLAGEHVDALDAALRPILEEDAAVGLNPILPLERMDDPSLRDLGTATRWGFFLTGRALGLAALRAREFMEECCGYENQNQVGE